MADALEKVPGLSLVAAGGEDPGVLFGEDSSRRRFAVT